MEAAEQAKRVKGQEVVKEVSKLRGQMDSQVKDDESGSSELDCDEIVDEEVEYELSKLPEGVNYVRIIERKSFKQDDAEICSDDAENFTDPDFEKELDLFKSRLGIDSV